jgi:hypothetical protein
MDATDFEKFNMDKLGQGDLNFCCLLHSNNRLSGSYQEDVEQNKTATGVLMSIS